MQTYFPEPDWGLGDRTWCAFDAPAASVVRMGLSPGASDRYRSQRHWQWVDVTGLPAGAYVMRGIANPAGYVVESPAANNVVDQQRVVPGTIADPLAVRTAPGQAVSGELTGTVMAPAVPARRSAACEPAPDADDCYVRVSPGAPLRFDIAQPPQHGQVSIGRGAGAHYTPDPGPAGDDRFTYTASDERGLRSPPATVTVTLRAEQSSPPPPTTSSPPARRLRLRRNGKRLYAVVRVQATCRVTGTLRRRGRVVRRIEPRRLAPGLRRVALCAHDRKGRYVLRLRIQRGTVTTTLTARLRVR